MIEYAQAIDILRTAAAVLDAVDRPVDEASGSIAAEAVHSGTEVPPFANSAMDGYALHAADTSSASTASPVEVIVDGIIAAGDAQPASACAPGHSWEIMTGAPLPEACDAIIPVENVTRFEAHGQTRIRVDATVDAGLNIRHGGEDIRAGQRVVEAGAVITPEVMMGLAAIGADKIRVRPQPRIAIVASGAELAVTGDALGPGMIRDVNGPFLRGALRRLGVDAVSEQRAGDTVADIERAVTSANASADVIITTGGVSVGRMDCVPAALAALGADILFHRVAIRPGKPALFARLPSGTLLMGLPGNPIAVAVGLRFLVVPTLRRLTGQPPETYHYATLTHAFQKKQGLRFFGKARAIADDSGQLQVEILPGQESFRVAPLMQANCWAIIDEQVGSAARGDCVQIAPLAPTAFLQTTNSSSVN